MPSSATVRRPDRTYGTVCKLMRHDLEAAGLPYRDASGRVADFHALRHSYITALAMSKAPVKVIQSLARHSTPTLTLGVYAHVGLADQTAALDALPGPIIPCYKAATPASSGGDCGHISDLLAHYLPTAGDGSCQDLTDAGGSAELPAHPEAPDTRDHKPLESLDSDVPSRVLSDPGGAEGVGFEPTVGFHRLRFSRPSHSATLAPLPRLDSGARRGAARRGAVIGRPRR